MCTAYNAFDAAGGAFYYVARKAESDAAQKTMKAYSSKTATGVRDGPAARRPKGGGGGESSAAVLAAKEAKRILDCAKVMREHGCKVSYSTSRITKIYLFSLLCVFVFLFYETWFAIEAHRGNRQ